MFDLLWRDDRDPRALGLDDCRVELATLPMATHLSRVTAVDTDVPWESAREQRWEGVIAKRRDPSYEHRRSRNWLKMKIEASQSSSSAASRIPKASG